MAKKKRALISGYIGFSNFGDDVMLKELVSHLKEKDYEITALSSAPKDTAEKFQINSEYYKSPGAILGGVLKSDVVISGGGNLIQNETSLLNLLYYLFIIFLGKLFFKKVVLYSQGIGPVNGFFPVLITKIILKFADMITVRDIYSQRILSKWGIKSKYTYDVAWNMETLPYSPKKVVGVQLREVKLVHKDFFVNLAKYIDMFFSDYEIRIFSLQNKVDASVCYKFEKLLKTRNPLIKTKVILYKDVEQTIKEFSELNYLIGMRLHANILGLKYGIKILPLSYSVKVRNLAYEFEIPFTEVTEDGLLHGLLTELTSKEQTNPKIEDARKRKFNWSYIDTVIDK